DVEMTLGLVHAGFTHVPKPVSTWRRGQYDLALVQEFLVGAVEGWALALTSLRDLYASVVDDPAEAGGDFAAEAERLGQMTAEMHLALASAFGISRDAGRAGDWADAMAASLDQLDDEDPGLQKRARQLVEDLRDVADPGPAIRV